MLAAVVGFLISHLVSHVTSHGRLIEPPSRASMWRYGFNTPPNYNDHELYCGGFTNQWQKNGGKCGICGDPWQSQPRPNEAGGKYATGTIVRKYRAGSTFTIRVELTANHRGYFEFRLCPNNNVKVAATQECLDQYVLRRSRLTRDADDEYHETRFYPGPENKVYEMKYKLPSDLTCTQCVIQWKYIAGNNWGMCPNGTGAVGCGPQEEFRACADIQISDLKGDADDTPFPTVKPVPTRRPTVVPTTPVSTTPDDSENEIPDEDDNINPTGGSSGVQETAENDASGGWFNWIFALFDSIWHMFFSFLGGGGNRSMDLSHLIGWSRLSLTKKFKFLRLIRSQAKTLGLKRLLDGGS
ncbi:hypothetical protein WDU94_010691 [Cyamophila willieti]